MTTLQNKWSNKTNRTSFLRGHYNTELKTLRRVFGQNEEQVQFVLFYELIINCIYHNCCISWEIVYIRDRIPYCNEHIFSLCNTRCVGFL
jgi:hypothetical protein